MLSKANNQYGEGVIRKYSKKLTIELGRGYNISSLKRIRQFYLIIEKGATMSHQLSWSHYVEIIKIPEIQQINYYIIRILKNNLIIRQLREKLKNKEYERLDDTAKEKLINNVENNIEDFIKSPILIKNSFAHVKISEKLYKD